MPSEGWAALLFACVALGAQVLLRPFPHLFAQVLFFVSACAIFGNLVFLSYAQYAAWAAGVPGRYLLPPYQGWDYFLLYVGSRLWAPWIVALIAAYAIPFAAKRLNKKYGERFFYEEEFGLMRLGTFLVGWPGFLLYVPLVLFSGAAFSAVYGALGRGRAPLRHLWMPLAIFVIIAETWLIPKDYLAFFNF